MRLRQRLEAEVREAVQQVARQRGKGARINRTGRLNAIVVRNVGRGDGAAGGASASAVQDAPIVQDGRTDDAERARPPDYGSTR